MKDNLSKQITKILIASTILFLCFFRNSFLPQNATMLLKIVDVVVLFLAPMGMLVIIVSISKILTHSTSEKKDEKIICNDPIRLWSYSRLFEVLEESPIIDLVIRCNGEKLKIGTMSDYGKQTRWSSPDFFDKIYYLEDRNFDDLNQFSQAFLALGLQEPIQILYMGLDGIPLDLK